MSTVKPAFPYLPVTKQSKLLCIT